jgi:hypothetical protein
MLRCPLFLFALGDTDTSYISSGKACSITILAVDVPATGTALTSDSKLLLEVDHSLSFSVTERLKRRVDL